MKTPAGSKAVLAAALIVLSSCAGAPRSKAEIGNAEVFREKAAILVSRLALDPEDEQPIVEGIASFLGFLSQEYGAAFMDALPQLNHPVDLGNHLASNYRTTTYRKMLDAFTAWDRSGKGEKWEEAALTRTETEHFALLTMSGTQAHRERDFIARTCEEYLDASAAILPDESAAERFHENMTALSDGKVIVLLPPSSRSSARFGKTATTNYGVTISGEGEVRIQASIFLPYYNALSTIGLAHEIIHVRDIMQKIDLASAPVRGEEKEAGERANAFKTWAQETFERTVPNDRSFGEGIAEYGSMRINPIRRSFCLSPDEELQVVSARTRIVSDILSQSVAVKDRRIRMVRHTELHSLVAFLIETHGAERFLDFYLRVPPDEANFIAAYGASFSEMQIRWRESLRR